MYEDILDKRYLEMMNERVRLRKKIVELIRVNGRPTAEGIQAISKYRELDDKIIKYEKTGIFIEEHRPKHETGLERGLDE